jgi:hypothetical protein
MREYAPALTTLAPALMLAEQQGDDQMRMKCHYLQGECLLKIDDEHVAQAIQE